jgi:hypothetical protein
MGESEKETVIIVHGTWTGLEPGKTRWFQPHDVRDGSLTFTAKLDGALKARGSSARCWAHCARSDQIFHWSPAPNSWIARTRAAVALADHVARLQNEGWICHLIGHSHGGNVVIEAAASREPLGNIVTLGTPFLDTMSLIRKQGERQRRIIGNLAEAGPILVPLLFLVHIFGFRDNGWQQAALYLAAGIALSLFLVILHRCIAWSGRKRKGSKPSAAEFARAQNPQGSFAQTHQFHTPLLALGSPMDEAWQVLHHLGTIDDPLAIRSGLMSYLFSSLRSRISRDADIARVHGATSYLKAKTSIKLWVALVYVVCIMVLALVVFLFQTEPNIVKDLSGTARNLIRPLLQYPDFVKEFPDAARQMAEFLLFLLIVPPLAALWLLISRAHILGPEFYSAFLSPVRWCLRPLGAVASIPFHFTTYVVRRKGWPVLLRMAMGLDGYDFTIPAVRQIPDNIPHTFVTYEDIPEAVQQRAMARRGAWITHYLGDVSEIFAKVAVTATDISALLCTVEEDQTLVHAAYYTDDECIVRIADWIAGKG